MYNLEKPGEIKSIENVDILATMMPPVGSTPPLNARLARHFAVINMTAPNDEVGCATTAVARAGSVIPVLDAGLYVWFDPARVPQEGPRLGWQ